jgi:hypothetical protein
MGRCHTLIRSSTIRLNDARHTLQLGLRSTPGHASGSSVCSQKPTGIAMIRHIVFFTAINDDNIETVRKGLQMLTGIPHA